MIPPLFGKILLILISGLLIVQCNVIVRNEDICGAHNGRRLYLELGEQGILYAKNVSFVKNSTRQHNSRLYSTNRSHDQCSLELVTCPSCAITITFKSLALAHTCNDGGVVMDSPCRCDYVWISEPPYEDISGVPYCGLFAPITYRSNTRTVSINLLYSQSHQHAFTLEYTADRNRLHLKGSSNVINKNLNSTGGGILTSPFFPSRYPRDLGIEYIITCPNEAASCRVRVLFSDFQIATVSIIEFYDWNGQRLDVSSGARFRPPIIVSTGPSLLIRFYANGGTNLGYKAFYSYIIGHLNEKAIQPITDCGGYVENLGGAITMIDMAGQGVKTFDCVWLIRPPKNFLHMKTHIYLKVTTFTEMAGNTELTIRQGPTSDLVPLEILRHPAIQLQPAEYREHIAPIMDGFHVSLRGTFGPASRLAIAYAAFGYQDCFSGSDFLCQNHRCIQSQLNCDGFDNCGDNSDEPSTCIRDWKTQTIDRKWHINKANYYFPKIDHYPDLKTATLVFVVSSLGLIMLISALIVLLYRMGARARQQRELQSRLQTISELLDRTVFDIADGARIEDISVGDDPPVYEAPPGYDEVVKVGVDHETFSKKIRNNFWRGNRNRNSLNPHSRDLATSSNLLMEAAGISNNNETTPILLTPKPIVPESPPPPYLTPPGSVRNHGMTNLSRNNFARTSVPTRLCTDHVRRVWQRDVEFSRSYPNLDHKISANRLYSSVDAEATLGAYLQNYATNTNAPIDVSDAGSQLMNSPNAVLSTSQECNASSGEHEDGVSIISDEETMRTNKNCKTNEQDSADNECACEGACGCANNTKMSTDFSCPKHAIIRLLRTGKTSTPNLNLTSTSTSSAQSSFTPINNVFDNDTEIMSMTDHTNIVSNKPNHSFLYSSSPILGIFNTRRSILTHGQVRKDVNCDTESLYESIKALDTFLAKSDIDTAHSLPLTLAHSQVCGYHRRRSQGSSQRGIFNCVPRWRSSDGAFSD